MNMTKEGAKNIRKGEEGMAMKIYAIGEMETIVQLLVTIEKQQAVSSMRTGKTYKTLDEAEKDVSALNTIKNLMILNSQTFG